jgi:NADH dehydrogenase
LKQVIVAGGGFAGINLIKELFGSKHYQVTLIDKNNYNYFTPLLYQVASAFIDPSNISYPFRRMFHNRSNVQFYMGSLKKVNPEQNTVETEHGTLPYDYLVLSMGTETNFFGMDNMKKYAMPMKTIEDAINLKNHMLLQIEEAVRAPALMDKLKYANIVIAGGGPTGVEIAGMLAEMARNIVPKDYPNAKIILQAQLSKIYLIDGGSTLLSPMSKKAQEESYKVLSRLGVEIILNTRVKDYDGVHVTLSDGKMIEATTLIWASGVIARTVEGLPKEVISRGNRVVVDEYNRVKGIPNIFVIGDQCIQTTDKNYPEGHPQLAQVAIQQGKLLAKNLHRIAEGKTLQPFAYNNKGSMAIISKYEAVADLPKVSFTGFFAWLIWLFIHIIPLVSFKNKLRLVFNWLWSFITNDPTLRLIIRPERNKASDLSIITPGQALKGKEAQL